jgi:SAM-dependent methyltransferase
MSQAAVTNPNQMPEAWSAAAPGYVQFLVPWQAYAEEALRLLPLGASDMALDVASGPGTLALLAARRARRVMAVDFAPGMIEALKTRALEAKLENVEAAVMDAQALTLGDASFDAAYCLFAFMFFPDRAKAFREMHRVLVPGGRALVATWGPIERRPMMQVGFGALREALPQLPLPGKGDLQSVAECEAEMRAAGFHDVKAHVFTASTPVLSPEHYLETITRSGAPMMMYRKKLGEEGWSAAMAAMLEAVRKRIPATGTALEAEALLTIGTR